MFLAEWDGLNSESRESAPEPTAGTPKGKFESAPCQLLGTGTGAGDNAPVVVLGATNRPTDLDQAFLRRMPVQIQTFMPDGAARAAILRAQLKNDALDADVDLSELAAATDNFSGSDIRELIRVAKQQRAKGLMLSAKEGAAMTSDAPVGAVASSSSSGSSKGAASSRGRALNRDNFIYALNKVASSCEFAVHQ